MRVAINGYFWPQEHTGSGQYLHHLWEQFSAPGGPEASLLLPGGTVARKGRAPVTTRAASGRLAKIAWEQWGVASAALRERVDLLHVPYLGAPIVGRLPVAVTVHDLIPWVVPGYAGSPVVRVYLWIAAQGAKRARIIIADSEASRRDAIRVLGVRPEKVRTVYLGVEQHPAFGEDVLGDVRARYGLLREYAFYIGGFDARKNVPLMLRAWKAFVDSLPGEMAEARPVLAVGGALPRPGGIFPDIEGQARTLGLSSGADGVVRFLGRIPEEDKARLMAAARVFVYSSAYEGFGLDPLEAMATGCPVVSSSGGSLEEVVGEGGLLVPPNDEAALVRAISRAWGDDDLRRALSTEGKRRAATFTWERTAAQTIEAYRAALARGRA
jgi:glycosyltransferase involved in cell wall biosynthesis